MEIIRFFNKRRPQKAIRWSGSTQEELEDFAQEMNWTPASFELLEDNSLLFVYSTEGCIIKQGCWFFGLEETTLNDEDMAIYASENWDIVPNGDLYSIEYKQGDTDG
jgi:hypothetical protein